MNVHRSGSFWGLAGFACLVGAFCPNSAKASQASSEQLNQLIIMDNTPDKGEAGEWYATAGFGYFHTPMIQQNYTFFARGQYSITDDIAVGGSVPFLNIVHFDDHGTSTGFGDIGLYGQYNLDSLCHVKHPDMTNVTVQVATFFPTGGHDFKGFNGAISVQPEVLAYHNLGHLGAGVLSAYGEFGFDISKTADNRLGGALAYDIDNFVGLMEFNYINSNGTMSPGVVYRGLRNWEFAMGIPINVSSTGQWGLTLQATFFWEKR